MLDYRVISIGTLSRHPLWSEAGALRTPHATTTLLRMEDRVIVVDPGIAPAVMAARLFERSGLQPQQVTDVFLTNFRPAHRGGLLAFADANWWISETERETMGTELAHRFEATDEADEELREVLRQEISLLRRCQVAPDSLGPQVDLFPLPGFTPGTTGLILALSSATVLVASDAVATAEHLAQGQVLTGAVDLEQASESFREAVEIADWLIPGHDNVVPNPLRRGF